MEYKKTGDKIYLRVDPEEDIIEVLQRVCRVQKIHGAIFSGSGYCSDVTLFTYAPDTGEFFEHDYQGLLTMASIIGNVIESGEDEIFMRANGVFSYPNSQNKEEIITFAGNLQKATVSYTAEIVISLIEGGLKRRDDIVPNLPVWKF